MKRRDTEGIESVAGDAARLFVRVDAGESEADADLARWLADGPQNERALERVELAVVLGRRLAADPASALYAEAAHAARTARRRTVEPALAWGGALAAALAVAAFILRESAPPPRAPEPVAMQAVRLVAVGAPSNPVAVLPNGVVVDASAVAVLPFAGHPTLANGLERNVVAALRTVPGLYVIADSAVSSYAYTDLSPVEIGTQLGARGIVDAAIELAEGRVRVSARLREAATGATFWQASFDRPVDELHAVRQELAEQIAASMLDSGLRAQVAQTADSSAGFAASKPFQQ